MRVLIVNDFARINGGAGKVAIESALALAGQGIPVHLFAAAMTADPAHEDIPNFGVTALDATAVKDMGARQKLVGGMFNAGIGAAFERVLDAHDPRDTVVHIHSLRDANTLSIMRPIERRGFRWLFTAHDYMLACPYSGFYDYELQAVCTRRPMGAACLASRCNAGSRLARAWFLLRFLAQRRAGLPTRTPHVVIASDGAEAVLRPHLPPSCRVHRLAIPIDAALGPRVAAERSDAFLYVGRFSPEKGAPLFAEAARRAGVRARLVGAGEDEAEVRRLNPDAELPGWADAAGVRAAVAGARAVVFPSRWLETFGMSAAEAVAVGVPALVSDAAVTREIPLQYGSGAVFPSGDVGALADLLARVAGDDALVEDWSRTGHARYAEDPLTMERHLRGLLPIYDAVLTG